MKILHAAETIKGGVATVMRQLMLAHTNEGDVKRVSCLIPANHRGELSLLDADAIHCFDRSGRNLASIWRFLTAFIKTVLRERPDVVHLHSSFAGVVGRICLVPLAVVARPKVVYCPHAFPFLIKTSGFWLMVYRVLERWLAFFTDAIICVSRHERQLALGAGLKADKLALVHNGIHRTKQSGERRACEIGSPLRLLFVGRFDWQKGFDVLLAAMRMLEEHPVELVAVGEPVHGVATPAAQNNVTYLGWLDTEALDSVFGTVHVLVVPSRWEGFAMVPLEGMSHGLPVIASDCSSLPEVVVNGVTGCLVPVEDSKALAECILSRTHAEWSEMGARGLTKFFDEFTASRMTESTLNIYRKLLNKEDSPYGLSETS
jgi:glycosyltransferase involved in cell wall biosynthesis